MSEEIPDWQIEKPLGRPTCSTYDCETDLHCFRTKRPTKHESYRNGRCVACGIEIVNWDRLEDMDINDAEFTVNSLKHERIRHYYWDKEIDEDAIRIANKRGLKILRAQVEKRIRDVIGDSAENLWRDGFQTPIRGNIIYYAQHATACCCRQCAEEWYGIKRNRPLKEKEIKFFVDMIMNYIKIRLPNLPLDAIVKQQNKSKKR